MDETVELKRFLALPGSENLRELGGYRTRDGNLTRWKVILRSGNVDRLSADSRRALLDYGLRTDIDLRAWYQRDERPDVFAHSAEVTYLPLPMFDERSFEARLDALPHGADGYWVMLTERAPAIRAVIEAVAAAAEGCTLIHCAAGKDRTGIICALLLGAVGIPDYAIIDDYALSERALTDPADEFRQMMLAQGVDPAEYDADMHTDPAAMQRVLADLRQHYGGLNGYLRAIGVSEASMARIRARLVDGKGTTA